MLLGSLVYLRRGVVGPLSLRVPSLLNTMVNAKGQGHPSLNSVPAWDIDPIVNNCSGFRVRGAIVASLA